jgi:ketosteroid isomerase-like protein
MAQDNVGVIEAAWEAFGKGDLDKAVEIAAPEGEIIAPDSLPWGGTYVGPDGFRDLLGQVFQRFDQFSAKPEKVLSADDDHVFVVASISGRARGGDDLRARVVWAYQLRDGKVVRAEAFPDTAAILDALG